MSLDCGVTGPMFVLGAGVIQVLCGEDERGEEDAVDSAAHTLCDWGQTGTKTTEVDETAHESGHLHL